MMYVLYIAFAATGMTSNVLTFLQANYLKYQVTAKLLNQVISKGFQVINCLLETQP